MSIRRYRWISVAFLLIVGSYALQGCTTFQAYQDARCSGLRCGLLDVDEALTSASEATADAVELYELNPGATFALSPEEGTAVLEKIKAGRVRVAEAEAYYSEYEALTASAGGVEDVDAAAAALARYQVALSLASSILDEIERILAARGEPSAEFGTLEEESA